MCSLHDSLGALTTTLPIAYTTGPHKEEIMRSRSRIAFTLGALIVVLVLGAAVAQSGKTLLVDSASAPYKPAPSPGVQIASVWGDRESGPHGTFTKFDPGAKVPLHLHTNDIRIVVIRGAYLYKPQNGPEVRVGAGSYFFIPGGDVHASGGDPKEGALFFEESTGKFDLIPK
jgi:quercetin dioxygenase-like cupin family protein